MALFRSAHHVPVRLVREVCWTTCMAALAAFWPGTALADNDNRGAENGYSYYHFKQLCRLNLDVNRIAILRAPNRHGTVAAQPDLSPFGLDASTPEPLPVSGWSFVKTTTPTSSGTAIRGVVRQIAGGQLVEFVSPVFLDDQADPVVITPRILVGFDRGLNPGRAEAILAESGAGEILDRDWANMKRTYRLNSASRDGFEVLEAANRLAQRPEVMFAEPDLMATGQLESMPNDTYFSSMWGLHNDGTFPVACGALPDFDMDAPEAWDITTGDPSIIVAILDDGVQLDHPDLNLYTPGFDATGEGGGGGPVNECDNHGTEVAGCVSGLIDNGLGIVGVAPGVRVASARMIVTSLACDLTSTIASSWVVEALAWAETTGARITNSSWYRNVQSAAIDQKYEDTRLNGMLHFGAAGNNASSTIVYPASLPSVNAVAALDPCGNRAAFSNYGVGLAFSAPGHYLISTDRTGSDGDNDGIDDGGCLPGGALGCNVDGDCGSGETCFLVSVDYALVAGTSFASPYAAGVAALVLSVRPDFTPDEVEAVLQQSAVDLGVGGYDTDYGWGFVNAANAVTRATVSVEDSTPPLPPGEFALRSLPNPFSAATRIEYDLKREATVQLRILDVSGRIVYATPAHPEGAGLHRILWGGTDDTGSKLVAGVYLIELRVDGVPQTRKALLLR